MEPVRHEQVELVLSVVRQYLLFANGVETMKDIVPLTLPIIGKYEVNRAGDLCLSPKKMEPRDLEELWRLVHRSAFDNVSYSNIIHGMVISSPTSAGNSWSISTPAQISECLNIMEFEPIQVLMLQL